MKYFFIVLTFALHLKATASDTIPNSHSLIDDTTFANIDDWVESPEIHQLSMEEKSEDAVILLNQLHRKYDGIKSYRELVHKIIHVNNDLGVKKYNRVYLQNTTPENILELKVRVIKKDGTIVTMNRSSLKKIENLEGYGGYVIFAIEGIEKGSEIEYFYRIEKELRTCAKINLRFSNSVRKQNVRIYFGNDFTYDAALTNPDSAIYKNNKGYINIEEFSVPKFSDSDAEIFMKNLEYCFKKLDFYYGYSEGYYNLFTLHDYQTRLINDFKKDLSAKRIGKNVARGELKKLAKVDKKAYIDAMLAQLHKDYKISNDATGDAFKTKNITKKGFIIAVSTALKKMKISHKIFVVGNRFKNQMNRHLFSYYNIDDFIIYIDCFDFFIDPTCASCGIQRLPREYLDSKLTFIFSRHEKNTDFNIYKSVRYTKTGMVTSDYSTQFTNYKVNLEDQNGALYDFKQIRTGYYAAKPISFIKYYNSVGKKYEDYVNDEVQYYGDSPKASNAKLVSSSNDTAILTATLLDVQIVQNAGDKIIFNLGKIIGGQTEMYDSITHNFPLILGYPKTYIYEIKIDIPEGYEIASTNNIKLHKIAMSETEALCEWTSDFVIRNNQIIINITEYYNNIRYEVKDIPAYREVINAAADFNKGVIIFKKKIR